MKKAKKSNLVKLRKSVNIRKRVGNLTSPMKAKEGENTVKEKRKNRKRMIRTVKELRKRRRKKNISDIKLKTGKMSSPSRIILHRRTHSRVSTRLS